MISRQRASQVDAGGGLPYSALLCGDGDDSRVALTAWQDGTVGISGRLFSSGDAPNARLQQASHDVTQGERQRLDEKTHSAHTQRW